MKQTVKFKKLTPNAIVPTYGTEFSAGADLYSGMTEPVIINAGTTEFIKTGIAMEIPEGLVGLVTHEAVWRAKKVLPQPIRSALLTLITAASLWLHYTTIHNPL